MMWKKIAVSGGVAVAVIGIGVATLTTTASAASPAPATVAAAASKPAAHHKHADPLARSLHAQWVTRDGKTEAYVTHDEIRGLVTAVSPISITVKAADGKSEIYIVNASTKVHERGVTKGKGVTGKIGDVKVGDRAAILGTGTTTMTATHVADAGVPKGKSSTTTKTTG